MRIIKSKVICSITAPWDVGGVIENLLKINKSKLKYVITSVYNRILTGVYQCATMLLLMASILICSALAQPAPSLSNGCSEFGQCSQLCGSGNSGCACVKGFTLGENAGSCTPIVDPSLKILFVGEKWIGLIERDGNGTESIKKLLPHQNGLTSYSDFSVRGLTYDARRRLIFWTDDGPGMPLRYGWHDATQPAINRPIYRTSLDRPSQPKIMFNITVKNPNG